MIVFAAELLLKVIAYGFFIGEVAYLKSDWNKVDFIVVIAGMIDQIAGVFLPSDDPALVRIFVLFSSSSFSSAFAAELYSNRQGAQGVQTLAPYFPIRRVKNRFANNCKIDPARPFNCCHFVCSLQHLWHSRRTVVHGEVQELQRFFCYLEIKLCRNFQGLLWAAAASGMEQLSYKF